MSEKQKADPRSSQRNNPPSGNPGNLSTKDGSVGVASGSAVPAGTPSAQEARPSDGSPAGGSSSFKQESRPQQGSGIPGNKDNSRYSLRSRDINKETERATGRASSECDPSLTTPEQHPEGGQQPLTGEGIRNLPTQERKDGDDAEHARPGVFHPGGDVSSSGGPKDTKEAGKQQKEFGSVAERNVAADREVGAEGSVVKKLGRRVRPHLGFIMTYFGLPTIACITGVLVTFYSVGPQHKGHMVQETTDSVLTRLAKDDNWVRNITIKYLQREDARKHLVTAVLPTLREEAQKVTFVTNVTNVTRIQYQCFLESEAVWSIYESQLKAAEEKLRKEYEEELKKQMEDFMIITDGKVDDAKDNLTEKIQDMKDSHSGMVQESMTAVQTITSEMEDVREKQKEIVNGLRYADQVMEVKGFLKIDSIGPILIALGMMDLLLMVCVCVLCARGVGSRSRQRGQGGVAVPNGGAIQQPAPLININNSNVVCVCFRDGDEKLSRTLGSQLLDTCTTQRPRLQTFVVNSMDDVQEIPACRVALVFVDPDEREMIIEDERYHIGQGLRRHAVQRLLDSGVEVFIVIFNDKKSVTLPSDQLYNLKLGQVDEHAQLKNLKRKDRVVSIKDRFHEHQTSLFAQEFNSIFG